MQDVISLKGRKVFVLKGQGWEHPVSEAQRRWAYWAEEQGKLPKGTAEKWSKRVKGKKLPKRTEDGAPVGKGVRLVVVMKAAGDFGGTISATGRRERTLDPGLPYSRMTAQERLVYEERAKEFEGTDKLRSDKPRKTRTPRKPINADNQKHTTGQDEILYGKGRD